MQTRSLIAKPKIAGKFTILNLLVILGSLGLGLFGPQRAAEAETGRTLLPVRWAYYARQPGALESLRRNIRSLDIVSPYYYVMTPDGRIGGSAQAEVLNLAHSNGVKVVPMVQNHTTQAEFHNLVSNPQAVKYIIEQIDYLVSTNGYDGFHIDFEDLDSNDRPYLTAFMSQLYARLKSRGKLTTMAVPAKTQEIYVDWGGPFDYPGLAPYLDLVAVMTYDYSYSASKPGPVAPLPWVEKVMNYAASQFGAAKVLLGIPFYGYNWNVTKGSNARAQTYLTIMEILAENRAIVGYDESFQAPYADYVEDGQQHRVWFENPRSLSGKLAVIQRYGLGGWAVWHLGQEGADYWPILDSVSNPTRSVLAMPDTPTRIYFKETGHTLSSVFLKFWQNNGGLERFGYPWTEEFEERDLLDGKIYIVQYFERARFEYRPENSARPVTLGLLGSELTQRVREEGPFRGVLPAADTGERLYFPQTGHTLSGPFRRFWENTGGLAFYGLPVSEPFTEQNRLDNTTYPVQYFERARLEYRPEKAGTRFEIRLGQLGTQMLVQKGWLVAKPK